MCALDGGRAEHDCACEHPPHLAVFSTRKEAHEDEDAETVVSGGTARATPRSEPQKEARDIPLLLPFAVSLERRRLRWRKCRAARVLLPSRRQSGKHVVAIRRAGSAGVCRCYGVHGAVDATTRRACP